MSAYIFTKVKLAKIGLISVGALLNKSNQKNLFITGQVSVGIKMIIL